MSFDPIGLPRFNYGGFSSILACPSGTTILAGAFTAGI